MGGLPRGVLGLRDPWRQWIARALMAGGSSGEILAALVEEGVPERVARRELDVIRAVVPMIREARHRASRAELALRLQRDVSSHAGAIERVGSVAADAFISRYYAANRPVIMTDILTDWPQLEMWTPGWFRRRFGDAEIRITGGRESDPDYDANTESHTRTIRLAEFVDRIIATDRSNDFYMVARNRNLESSPLAALLSELDHLPAFLDPDRVMGCVALWFGPAGTRTPLHHDTCNILFCQIHGRKRVWLISPLETAMTEDMRGVYSTWDCEDTRPEHLRGVTVHDVVLAPGEALFIPVGWWHQVLALDVSISLAFTNFIRRNRFDWYAPGAHR